jgi:CRP/FNR family transcriptional regulator
LYGRGETIGEAAMWSGGKYPAHAQVLTEAAALAISRQALTEMVSRSPELAVGIMAGLSNKLQEFASLVERLSLKEVPSRLAAAILEESRRADSARFKLTQTKRQLAAQIGTAPETLSRALARLKAAGFLEVRGSEITIIDPAGLKDAAEAGL